MSTLQELQEKRNTLATKIREYADKFNENKAWPDAETEQAYNQVNADYDAISKEMEQATTAEAVSARMAAITEQQNAALPGTERIGRDDAHAMHSGGRRVGGDGATCTDEHRALALAGWMRYQMGEEPTEQMSEAARVAGYNFRSKTLKFNCATTEWTNKLAKAYSGVHQSRRANRDYFNAPLTTTTGSTGGFTIPAETLITELEINMLAFGGMAQVADLMVTQTGESLKWPTADDTGNSGVLIGESTNLDNSGAGGPLPTFAQVTWEAYKFSSQAVLVPYELLEDNVVNLTTVLGQMLGERLGRIRNTYFTTGTGSSQPNGIVTASTLGVTAASATVITTDEVYDLQHSVDPAYRNGAGFMCHDDVILHLRKKKDSQNNYIWQSGFNTGVPDTLAGSPVTVNQDMATHATGNVALLYGQLNKYKIRRVNGFRMYRLEERYRDSDQDGFMMLLREDGNLLDAGTAPVKNLTMA